MPTLAIHTGHDIHRLQVAEGINVREALDSTEWRVRAACGGSGACGACVVRLLGGAASGPTVADYLKLTPDERDTGQRLACQMRILGDVEILLDQPAPPSAWKSIAADELLPVEGCRPELMQHIYGLAVDLGTTHIRVAFWDRKRGQRIATRRGPNPQGNFGADVLNRLAAACRNPAQATELAKLARHAIIQAVRDILARDVGEVTPMLAEIGEVLIVGNTAMLALLTGHGAAELLATENWQRAINVMPPHDGPGSEWQQQWFMPNAQLRVLSPVAGFIGSDLIADLYATRLCNDRAPGLLLDIGTNTEIALWDGSRLHVTSVPGGPAFEAVGIRHGMAAEPGAICRVQRSECGYRLETIGGLTPRGFCGSGLVDAIASLRASGELKPSGRFVQPPGAEGLRLDLGNPRTALTGGDIDAFQRAKAAIGAAMEILLQRAALGWNDVQRVCVCGAFGNTLDVANAQALGLLPPLAPERITLLADASLIGAELALLHAPGTDIIETLTAQVEALNLSLVPGYDDRYIDHLRLRAIPTNP